MLGSVPGNTGKNGCEKRLAGVRGVKDNLIGAEKANEM